MTSLKTPYHFIPAAPFVLSPEWAAQANHDHPFMDGLSGELSIALRNDTPLCVGGQQDEATENAAGKVHFYRTPDGKMAIPGSSLKGMLRNALAPVVFARMSQVEERKLSVRDISTAGTYYHNNIVQQIASAGWLRFHNGQWQIQPCSYVRIHQAEIISHLKLDANQWKRASTVKSRYELLGGVKIIKFDIAERVIETKRGNKTVLITDNVGQGNHTGSLVVTGQPGSTFEQAKAKKWEFVFYDEKDAWLAVSEQAMRDFLFVHENSNEWAFLRSQGHGQDAIPVFFHGSASDIKSMGLASMYRLAQQNSVHDALRNISEQHLSTHKADLTDLLFGRLQPDQTEDEKDAWGLRGRVNLGLFQAEGEPSTQWTDDTVLSSPKPSFHPAYLQQEILQKQPDGQYVTLDSKKPLLQGWKRYPVKPKNVQKPPRMEDGRDISNKVKVRLETVAEASVFHGKIRFHNLRPVELGALLWILDFGGRDELRHALGMGKPYGLGQVQLSLNEKSSRLIANDRAALAHLETADILTASKQVFLNYMNQVWETVAEVTSRNATWESSPQVVSLLAMADPWEGTKAGNELQYFVGTAPFLKVKQDKGFLRAYADYTEPGWTAAVNAPLVSNSEMTLEQALELAAEEKKAEQEKEERAAARENMLAGEKALDEINEVLEALSDVSELTATLEKNQTKEMNSIADLDPSDLPSLEYAEPILQLAESFDKKRLTKAANKIRKLLTPK